MGNLIGPVDRCRNSLTWLNIPEIRLCTEKWLACCFSVCWVDPYSESHCGLMEVSGTGHWPTKSPICQAGCNPGRREGSGGLTLMSLLPGPAGPAVPDTPLSHSLIKPATVNSWKHGAEELTQTHHLLPSIIHPPCEWFPGNCRF